MVAQAAARQRPRQLLSHQSSASGTERKDGRQAETAKEEAESSVDHKEAEATSEAEERADRQRVDAAVEAYNARFAHRYSYSASSQWAPRAVLANFGGARRLIDSFSQLPARDRALLVLLLVVAFAYLISPFDLLPESAFGVVGLLDDVLFIIVLTNLLGIYARRANVE